VGCWRIALLFEFDNGRSAHCPSTSGLHRHLLTAPCKFPPMPQRATVHSLYKPSRRAARKDARPLTPLVPPADPAACLARVKRNAEVLVQVGRPGGVCSVVSLAGRGQETGGAAGLLETAPPPLSCGAPEAAAASHPGRVCPQRHLAVAACCR
jgi:hypothetical protein